MAGLHSIHAAEISEREGRQKQKETAFEQRPAPQSRDPMAQSLFLCGQEDELQAAIEDLKAAHQLTLDERERKD